MPSPLIRVGGAKLTARLAYIANSEVGKFTILSITMFHILSSTNISSGWSKAKGLLLSNVFLTFEIRLTNVKAHKT